MRGPTAQPTSSAEQLIPNCALHAAARPLYRALTSTQQAFQDFQRQAGAPYSVLYLAVPTNNSNQSQCIRLVQRAPHRFMRYTYLPRLDSVLLTDSTCQGKLERLPTGYFINVCEASWSDPFCELVLVKHDTTTQFSLYLENGPHQRFSPDDDAILARGRAVIKRMTQ
jgi:hypothetical protein